MEFQRLSDIIGSMGGQVMSSGPLDPLGRHSQDLLNDQLVQNAVKSLRFWDRLEVGDIHCSWNLPPHWASDLLLFLCSNSTHHSGKQRSNRGIPLRCYRWGTRYWMVFCASSFGSELGQLMECLPKMERAGFLNGKMESMPRKGDFFSPIRSSTLHYTTIWWMGCEQKT